MNDYDELLENWETNVENFMNWIEVVCGVDRESNTYAILTETVITQSDLDRWINCFDGNIDNVSGITEEYISCITEARY